MEYSNIMHKALKFFLLCTLVLGLGYTLVVTLFSFVFYEKANGSLLTVKGITYGSELIGQNFDDSTHLWGRPNFADLTSFHDEEGKALYYGKASNLSPVGDAQETLIKARQERIEKAHPEMVGTEVPQDLLTASGSGLDGEISPEAAEYQVKRIAKNTGKSEAEVRTIIEECTKDRFLGVFGEERVNVLRVNLALDGILEL